MFHGVSTGEEVNGMLISAGACAGIAPEILSLKCLQGAVRAAQHRAQKQQRYPTLPLVYLSERHRGPWLFLEAGAIGARDRGAFTPLFVALL